MPTGKCNCGSVAFEISAELSDVYVCHCSICLRFTGSDGIAVVVVANDVFRWTRGSVQIIPLLVPHDCSDGFLYAYWRRPAAYLNEKIRSGSSSFWAIGTVEQGLEQLKQDLETGEWERRYAELLGLESYDAGYRLVLADR